MDYSLRSVLKEQYLWQYNTKFSLSDCTALTRGQTNSNYLIQKNNTQWVLRINSPFSQNFGIDRDLEQRSLKLIAHLDFAPQIIYSDPKQRYLITQYIVGKHRSIAELNARQRENLIQCIAQYQKIVLAVTPLDYVALLQHYQRQLSSAPIKSTTFTEIQALQQSSSYCFTHHDLRAENILWRGDRCFILDWESAGSGIKQWDATYLGLSTHCANTALVKCIKYINQLWYALHQKLHC